MKTSRWPISHLPISGVTPFTYRDGETYLSMLNRLAQYVTEQLHPNLRKTVEHMVEELEHILAAQHGKYVEGVQDFQRIHDAFMTDVNSALMALNDNAVSDLADDPGTVFGQKLRELFASHEDMNNLMETTVRWDTGPEYWVSVDGSDTTGDGSRQRPYATPNPAIQHAIDNPTRNTSSNRDSSITIHMGPGVYRGERPNLPTNTSHNMKIRFIGADVGGHPNVPLTQFHDYDQIVFWTHNPNLELYLENIKFVNCNSGVSVVNGKVYAVNVHAERCNTGLRNSSGFLTVYGGIFTDCQNGIYSFMVNRHTIGSQHAGNTNAGPWFRDCHYGVRLQETVTGHVDYCLFEDCHVGIRVNRGANVNPEGSEFYRCGTGILAERNSTSLYPAARPMVFGTGPDRNGKNIDAVSGSNFTGGPHWTSISNGDSMSESFIKSDVRNRVVSGPDGLENAVNETLKPEFWTTDGTSLHADKSIVWKVYGHFYGDGTQSRRIRFHVGNSTQGGGYYDHDVTDYSEPIVGGFESTFELVAVTDQQQIIKATTHVDGMAPFITVDRLSMDLTQEQTVRIITSVTGEGAHMRIHNVQAWIRGL